MLYNIPIFVARGVEAMITVSDIEEFLKEVRCFIDAGRTDFILVKENML